MNTTSEGSRFKKLARLCGIASALLMAAWLLPPAIHSYRHLCPVRPDGVTEAGAVPSFARQTGMSCAMCHTVFPELTPMGRRFKLNGYTLTTKPADVSDYSITNDTAAAQRNLILSYVSPLSYGVQSAYAKFSRAPKDLNAGQGNVPASAQAQGDTVQFPEQVSLYYNGRVSDNIGAWFQLTYAGNSGTLGIDNTEIRYADHSDDRKWVYGTFVNNTVGMQDVYNTATSAFGVPLFNVPSLWNLGVGAGGLAGPITNNMFTNSAGIGEYVFYNDSLYAEISGYHSGVQGALTTDNKSINAGGLGAIDGVAPRVRLAYEKDWDQNSAEIGLVGMQSSFIPVDVANNASTANSPVTANQYLNGAADFQLQHIGDDNIFTLLGSYSLQRESNNPAFVGTDYSNQISHLNQLSLTGSYYYRRHYGGLVNFVDTNGTKDQLQYGADGSPHNQYWVFELDYMPWLNTRFILQYDAYTVVNGNQSPFYQANGASGVDGKASNNNTFVVGLWLDF